MRLSAPGGTTKGKLGALALIPVLVVACLTPATGDDAERPLRVSVISERLKDGSVKLDILKNGSVVARAVGAEGSVLELKESLADTEGTFSISLTPPDPANTAAAAWMARQYRLNRRSPDADVAALAAPAVGVPWTVAMPGAKSPVHDGLRSTAAVGYYCVTLLAPPDRIKCPPPDRPVVGPGGDFQSQLFASVDDDGHGDLYDSGCVQYSGAVYWRGCYTRFNVNDSDSNHDYSADKQQASGHGANNGEAWMLTKGGTTNRYSAQSRVVQWNPGSTQPGGSSCHTVTGGITVWGFSFSESHQVCPSRVSPQVANSSFAVNWFGEEFEWVGAGGVDAVSYTPGASSGLVYGIQGTFCKWPC